MGMYPCRAPQSSEPGSGSETQPSRTSAQLNSIPLSFWSSADGRISISSAKKVCNEKLLCIPLEAIDKLAEANYPASLSVRSKRAEQEQQTRAKKEQQPFAVAFGTDLSSSFR